MAKKTSKKTKKSAKKSAKKKKLAKTTPTKKPAKKPAKKSTKKTGAKATRKAKATKSAAKPVAKAAVKRPRAKSKTSRTSPAIASLAEEKAKEATKPKKPGKASLKPFPEQTEEAAAKKLPAGAAVKPASPSQHLFANLLARVHAACRALAEEGGWSAGIDLSRVVVEPPRDVAHGDMATNAAMVLAKDAKVKPRDLAEQIAAKLRADDLIASVDVAGPGFINLSLKASVWSDALRTVLREGDRYGRSAVGAAEKVNVEYVSANPTGPMHVGHCRGAVFGDALVSLLQFAGYDVTREYYVNDAGAGRCAGALGFPALPRSARPGHRRNSGRTLSRRLSEAGGAGAGG